MTQTSRNGGRPAAASTQELRAEVEHARDELAETVSQLAAKADLKSRARMGADKARAKVHQHEGRYTAGQGPARQGAMVAAGGGALALVVLAAVLYRQRHT